MLKLLSLLFVLLLSGVALAENEPSTARAIALEQDLQSLPWEQFRAVLMAIPKLKASVDVYGALGWQFVRSRYATHNWRKGIDKLDEVQKQQLAELIRKAKSGIQPPSITPPLPASPPE
jgi:hypothetical protein